MGKRRACESLGLPPGSGGRSSVRTETDGALVHVQRTARDWEKTTVLGKIGGCLCGRVGSSRLTV